MTPVFCSNCNRVKGESLHWILLWTERKGQRFCALPWIEDPAIAREESVWKVCGQECAMQTFSRWMSLIKVSVPVEIDQ